MHFWLVSHIASSREGPDAYVKETNVHVLGHLPRSKAGKILRMLHCSNDCACYEDPADSQGIQDFAQKSGLLLEHW